MEAISKNLNQCNLRSHGRFLQAWSQLFIRRYRLIFINLLSFPFSSCCVVVTEYPAVNKLTALRLAPKSTLVVVARTRGSHFHRSSVCTWCRDQNVIKGSRMKLQDNQKIKDRMNIRSSDQDIKVLSKSYFRLFTLAM